MENIEIKKIDFKGSAQVNASEEGITITQGDRKIMLTDDHYQDCCESVYADWSAAKPYIKDSEYYISEIVIKKVPEMGLLICLGDDTRKIFIPCYNEQNGYYSSNLALVITDGAEKTIIDISDVTDYIDK